MGKRNRHSFLQVEEAALELFPGEVPLPSPCRTHRVVPPQEDERKIKTVLDRGSCISPARLLSAHRTLFGGGAGSAQVFIDAVTVMSRSMDKSTSRLSKYPIARW